VINTIETGVQRMTQMLDRVLLLGKVEAQMLEFQPAEINLQTLCQDLVEDARIQHSEAGCELALEFEASPAVGLFDEKLLRHIFGNLLSNAIKYSPQGGKVLFRVFSSEGRVAFEVADQGIGIPAEELPHLFEWFHRASNVGEIPGHRPGAGHCQKLRRPARRQHRGGQHRGPGNTLYRQDLNALHAGNTLGRAL
jgi:signal transduction histidine kinase